MVVSEAPYLHFLETVFTSHILRKVSWVIGRATITPLFLRFVLILEYYVLENTTVLISKKCPYL